MGASHNVTWISWDIKYSCYYPKNHTIYTPEKVQLGALIHEINECETFRLLKKFGLEESFITMTQDMYFKYKWLFPSWGHVEVNDEIWVTHIISPYGCCGCCMPRRKYRVRW